jgi:hypothetical protein
MFQIGIFHRTSGTLQKAAAAAVATLCVDMGDVMKEVHGDLGKSGDPFQALPGVLKTGFSSLERSAWPFCRSWTKALSMATKS